MNREWDGRDGERVVCRPHAGILVFAAILAGFGAACAWAMAQPSPSDRGQPLSPWVGVTLASIFYGPGLAMAWWATRSRIEADAAGLRWRTGRRGWRSAAWDDVADFYYRAPASAPTRVVELRDGTTIAFDGMWTGYRTLSETIARAARRSRAAAWGFLGARPVEWPKTFGYDLRRLRRLDAGIMGQAVAVVLLFGGGSASLLLWDALKEGRVPVSHGLLAAVALAEGAFIGRGIWNIRRTLGEARRWADEWFRVTEDGFTFFDGREETVVPWSKVTGYDFNGAAIRRSGSSPLKQVPKPCVIATEWGRPILFSPYLTQAGLFMEIVRQRATNGIESKRDAARAEALGGVRARWSGGDEGKGDLIYHARTRSSRTLLMLPWSLAAIMPALGLVRQWSAMPGEEHRVTMWPYLLLAAGCGTWGAWGVYAMYRVRLCIGAEGVTYRGLFGERSIAWEDVARWEVEGDQGRIEAKDGSVIRFMPSMLAYGAEIADQLKGRLGDPDSHPPAPSLASERGGAGGEGR